MKGVPLPLNQLFRFTDAVQRDLAVDAWLDERPGALGAVARRWFEIVRAQGDDIRELMHDGRPTACVQDAAFAYVDVFTHHVNVGFFRGSEIADPSGLLQGTGKLMRHVKLRSDAEIDDEGLTGLIEAAYRDMRGRV